MLPLFPKEKRFFENKGVSNRLAVRAEFFDDEEAHFFFFKAKAEMRFRDREIATNLIISGYRCQIVLINLLR